MKKKINKNKWLRIVALLATPALAACGHEINGADGGDSGGAAVASATQESGPVNSITNSFSTPSEMRKGDILVVNFDSKGRSLLSFDGVAADAEFNLIVGTAETSDGSYRMDVADDLAEVPLEVSKDATVAEGEEVGIQEEFELWRRANEFDLAVSPRVVHSQFKSSQVSSKQASINEGDVEKFRVLGSISSGTEYKEVSAEAECVGTHVVFYVDREVDASELSKAEVTKLCNQFDSIAGAEQSLLGSLSDINGDGRVQVVMTPQVNRLGGLGGGIITGFFNASDLYPRSGSNPVSNEREVLFVMVPDSAGRFGVQISKNFAFSNLLPAVLPHELQHAISYNQHVFVNKGQPEEPWLNEAMSHLTEDLMGMNQENPSRTAIYLSNPSSYSLVTNSQPGLAARGGSYLFLRYLYEQSENPNGFLQRLLNTSSTGAANIENAFAGRDKDFDQFREFFLRWNIALAMSNRGLTSDSRYIYQNRVHNDDNDNWSGACIVCEADDNRGTVLSGMNQVPFNGALSFNFSPTTAKVFDMTDLPNQLVLDNNLDADSFGVLIRVR